MSYESVCTYNLLFIGELINHTHFLRSDNWTFSFLLIGWKNFITTTLLITLETCMSLFIIYFTSTDMSGTKEGSN